MSINDRFRSVADAEADKFDRISRAVTTLRSGHRFGHEGLLFHGSGKVTGLANGGAADFAMVVPANCYPHIQRVHLSLGRGDIDFVMYEGATFSAAGALLTTFPVNRNSSNTAQALIYGGPTVTDVGTAFHTHWAPPTGSGVGSAEGLLDVTAFGEEWVLKPEESYLMRITNNSGGTISYRWEFVWYEPDWTRAGK